jgi:uncharacterized protein YraI
LERINPMFTRSLAALLATAAALAIPAAAEAAYTASSVNLRTGPGTNYGIIVTLPAGTYVAVGSCQYGWCSVSTNGYNGWIASSYIGGGGPPSYPQTYVYQAPPPPPTVYIAPAPYAYPAPYVYPRPYYRPRPNYYFNFGFRGW